MVSGRNQGRTEPLWLNKDEPGGSAIWTLDDEGRIEGFNAEAGAFGSMSEAGAVWSALWPRDARTLAKKALVDARRGRPARFVAFFRQGRTGSYWQATLSAMPGRGESAIIAVAQDVTAAVETRRFLETVIDVLPQPLVVKDAQDQRYVLVNPAAASAFGRTARQIFGRHAREIFPPELSDRIDRAAAAALTQAKVFHDQVEGEWGGLGGPRRVDLQTLAIRDEAGPRYILTLGQDVTEHFDTARRLRAALAAAEQADRVKTEFLTHMSHELRTPLNGVVAAADLLGRLDLSPRARQLAQLIAQSGQSLERLIADVLDVSRLEEGHLTLKNSIFDLSATVQAAAALAALEADAKGLPVIVQRDPSLPARVRGDPDRLAQVLGNLLSNAVKFTDSGQVVVGISAKDDRVWISVADTGVGFAPEDETRIFDRFSQGDRRLARRHGGLGLGLPLARDLVDLMGGELHCQSAPGRGSRFWFDLPLAPEPAVEEALTAPVGWSQKPRILVADDHVTNRLMIELLLDGLAVLVFAEDGRQAVDAFAGGPFDLVLMDMQMPVMDGLTAIREIRRIEDLWGQARTPIAMVTANTLAEHQAASRGAGADLHVGKPFTGAGLLATVADALALGRTWRPAAAVLPDEARRSRG